MKGDIKNIRNNLVAALLSYIAIALIFTFAGMMVGSTLSISLIRTISSLLFVVLIIGIFLAIFAKRPKKGGRRRRLPIAFVNIYSFIIGITLYPAISYYVYDLGGSIVLGVILGTLIFVGILALIAFKKGNDNILRLGPILFALTLGILAISLFMVFFENLTQLDIIITVISIFVFSLWVVYDVYRFKKNMYYIESKEDLAPYVLDIYVDIINLMMDILRLISRFDN